MSKNRFYAVVKGRIPGVYSDWLICKAQVDGFSGAIYKGFPTKAEAEAYYKKNKIKEDGIVAKLAKEITGHKKSAPENTKVEYKVPDIIDESKYVLEKGSNGMRYKGKIDKVFFKNDTWSTVRMNLFLTGTENTVNKTVVGIADPIEDQVYSFDAEIKTHAKYGEQLVVSKYALEANDAEIFTKFMSEYIKGIGPQTAKAIYETYGTNLFEILDTNPDMLLSIPKMNVKKVKRVVDYYNENYKNIVISNELFRFTEGNITPLQAKKIIEKYGETSLDVVKANPYVLTEIAGFGFLTVDKIALSTGIKEDSKNRIQSAIIFILKKMANDNGHTHIFPAEMEKEIMPLLLPYPKEYEKGLSIYVFHKNKGDDVDPILNKLSEDEREVYISYANKYERFLRLITDSIFELNEESKVKLCDDSKIYLREIFAKECECASNIAYLATRKAHENKINTGKINRNIKKFEKDNGYALDEEQVSAVFKSLKNRISVITGGAGRGKTTIIKLIISGWTGPLTLCAPTGRAAQRMSEATGCEAGTIHRTIYDYKNETKKDIEEGTLIIVDESSMINLILGYDLIERAVSSKSQIIFVGDSNQLPPIGVGNFFAQLVKTERISVSRLEKAYRQMGSINHNADLINEGKMMMNFIKDEQFRMVQMDELNKTEPVIRKLWEYARKKYDIKDIRVLSPMRRNGITCTNNLNKIIREMENPENELNKIPGSEFRVGDRVMQMQNDYNMLYLKSDGETEEAPLFNGETGTIVDTIKYEGDDYALISLDTGETVYYPVESLKGLDLAYASTVHKSQGSEYKCTIIFITTEHFIMLKRNLLYTAVSRCKEENILVNTKASVNKAISDTSYAKVNCVLAERIDRRYEELTGAWRYR